MTLKTLPRHFRGFFRLINAQVWGPGFFLHYHVVVPHGGGSAPAFGLIKAAIKHSKCTYFAFGIFIREYFSELLMLPRDLVLSRSG